MDHEIVGFADALVAFFPGVIRVEQWCQTAGCHLIRNTPLLGSHCIVRSGSKAVARASARPANTVMSLGKGGIDVIQVLSGKLANRLICIPQTIGRASYRDSVCPSV